MKTIVDYKRFFIILVFLMLYQQTIAQKVVDTSPKLKHSITASYGLYTFYDGMPIFHRSSYSNSNKLRLSRGFGLRYLHQIDDKNAWSISSYLYFYLLEVSHYDLLPGSVEHKNFMTGQGNYHRTWWSNQKHKITSSIGLMFRGGFEYLHGGFYGGGDGYTVTHDMLDAGIPLGIQYTYFIGKHWHITTLLEHTFFPYVYASKRKRDYPYEWDNGASRNMTKLSIGIGVNFGEVKAK